MLIKGVEPVTANRIVAHFGLETLDIIENQISRLIEVPGIAKKRVYQYERFSHPKFGKLALTKSDLKS